MQGIQTRIRRFVEETMERDYMRTPMDSREGGVEKADEDTRVECWKTRLGTNTSTTASLPARLLNSDKPILIRTFGRSVDLG